MVLVFEHGAPREVPEYMPVDVAVGCVRQAIYGFEVIEEDDALIHRLKGHELDEEDPGLRRAGGRVLLALRVLLEIVIADGELLVFERDGKPCIAEVAIAEKALAFLLAHDVAAWIAKPDDRDLPSGDALAAAWQGVFARLERDEGPPHTIPGVARDRLWTRLGRLGVPPGRGPSEEWLRQHGLALPRQFHDDERAAPTPSSPGTQTAWEQTSDVLASEQWASAGTIARLWDVPEATVHAWVNRGDPRVPEPVVQGHRLTRYNLQEVLRRRERWVRKQRRARGGDGRARRRPVQQRDDDKEG